MLRVGLLAIVVTACQRVDPDPQPLPTLPTTSGSQEPAVRLREPIPVDAPAHEITDDEFRAAVRVFAARDGKHRTIGAWGTLHLDGTRKPYRFARLNAAITVDWQLQPDSAECGVYLVEQAPDTYWLLAFWWADAHNGYQREDYEPAWQARDDDAIVHFRNHNHGASHATIALRGGRWVVLREDDWSSRFDDDIVTHEFADARDACKRPCPPAAQHSWRNAAPIPWWPAHSIAELTEPSANAMNADDFRAWPSPEVDHVVPRPGP